VAEPAADDDRIRVLIVDDHAVVREGLRTYLALQDGIDVVGEAADGEAALEQAAALAPDVILMDLVMPGRDGIGAMQELRARGATARVIVLTSFTDEDRIMPAIQAGAAGYLLKNVQPAELARAVRAAHAGEALLDPAVAARLVEAVVQQRTAAAGAPPPPELTPREHEVLELIVAGMANKRIALELGLSEKTVKAHVGHLLAKLGVADRTQAALLAVRTGLVADPRS
jgi:DNA-binding NarL/FixJ family response regulator